MAAQANQIWGQPENVQRMKGVALVIAFALAGCFGPPSTHYDIQAYNRAVVSSEQEMLLFNIGRLSRDQPPHFMMLSEVDQTRAFSAGAAFQWSHLWNSLFIPLGTTSVTAKGSDVYQVGPFAAASSENPTVKFIPIQGTDFAQRFESSLTDKFSLFLEDRRWYATPEEREALVMLFAQSLYLSHGNEPTSGGKCGHGLYLNRSVTPQESIKDPRRLPRYGAIELSTCVDQIVKSQPIFEQIDGSHLIPTTTSEPPKAADVVSALQAGYKWTTNDKGYVLANPVRIPAYLDYIPWYPPPPPADQQSSNSLPPVWWSQKNEPDWKSVDSSKLPNYQWKLVTNEKKGKQYTYALVPDGYDLKPDGRDGYKLARLEDVVPRNQEPLLYTDEIVRDVWPVPQNYFYVELRNESDNNVAERVCFAQPDNPKYEEKDYDKTNSVVCGYFKIGNFLQILQRLAKMACTGDSSSAACQQSIFGIGSKVPPWADSSTSYTYRTGEGVERTEKIWVPAHDPKNDPHDANDQRERLAERDRKTFFTVYKLYQMSLVDTSKLVTGTTPITISK